VNIQWGGGCLDPHQEKDARTGVKNEPQLCDINDYRLTCLMNYIVLSTCKA